MFSAAELPIYEQENLIQNGGCNFIFQPYQAQRFPGAGILEFLASLNKSIQRAPSPF